MKLHIQYLRSLEDSERVRKACLAYIQTWCRNFYPERPDLMQEARQLAASARRSTGSSQIILEVCCGFKSSLALPVAKRVQPALEPL